MHLFNDLLIKTEDECTEKMRTFSHSIPGFELMSRSSAKKMFNFFKFQKVKKGWKMYSYDYIKNGMSSIHNKDPLKRYIYIIHKGTFVFQSFNKPVEYCFLNQ